MVGEIETGFLIKVIDKSSKPIEKIEKAIEKVKKESKDYSKVLVDQAKAEEIVRRKLDKRSREIVDSLSDKARAQFIEQTGVLEQIAAEEALTKANARSTLVSRLKGNVQKREIVQNARLAKVLMERRKEQERLTALAAVDTRFISVAAGGTIALGIASAMANEKMNSMRLTLEAATGSAKDAAAIFKRLQKFSEVVPVPTSQIVDADVALIEYTGSQKKAEAATKRLSMVAGDYTLNLGTLTQSYVRLNEQHRFGRRELGSLGRAASPMIAAMKEIAKQNNVSAATFNRFMMSGRLSSEWYTKALEKITDKGGAAYNMLQKRNETFMANLVEFRNIANVYLDDLWKMITGTDTLGKSFKNLNDILRRAEPAKGRVGEIRKDIGTVASPVGTIGGMFSMISKIIQSTRAYESGSAQHVTVHVDDPKGYVKHVSGAGAVTSTHHANIGTNMAHVLG